MSGTEWSKLFGYGQPVNELLRDAVVLSIRQGNLTGAIEIRVAPHPWEGAVIQLGEHRPVTFEFIENRAHILSFVCGRKVRVICDDSMDGEPDVLHWRAVP